MALNNLRLLILSYLSKNPEAKDTIDGIQWWILRECVDLNAEQIRRTVDELVLEELLVEWRLATSTEELPRRQQPGSHRNRRKIYSLNKAKLEEISRILGEADWVRC